MSVLSCNCPNCGSSRTESRRQLFHDLMEGTPGPEFSWYQKHLPGANPPHSRFVVMLALLLGMALPIAGLWLFDMHLAVVWLGMLALMLVGSLLLDLALTYQRYKIWGREWLCADCRAVFNRMAVPEHYFQRI